MQLKRHRILGVMIASIFVGCATQQKLKPEATSVEIQKGGPARIGCKNLGEVKFSQEKPMFTSNEKVFEGAENGIKNKAQEMGANLVIISNTKTRSINGLTILLEMENVTRVDLTGAAFNCSPRVGEN